MAAAFAYLPPGAGGGTRCACWTDGLVVACALLQRGDLAWPAPLSHRPTLQRFWKQGDSPCTSRREPRVPCTLLRETSEAFAQHCGGLAVPPAGAAPAAPCLGDGTGRLPDPHPNLPPSTGAGTEEFPRPQPHSLIVCDSLIVCAPAFSSPVGVEPLQRRYKALQAVTEALPVVTEPLLVVTSRYGAVTNLASRYGVGRLKMSLCLTAAFAPVPAILGGSCPLGCSLSAPATGGLSMVSAVPMYAAGSEKEKRAGGPLHWGHYSTLVRILQWGVGGVLPGRMVLLWSASSFSGGSGLACAVVPPAHPPTFLETGGPPLHPRREPRVPCTLLRETGEAFAQHCGGLAVPPAGAAPAAPCLGDGGGDRGRGIGTPFQTFPRVQGQAVWTPFQTFPRVQGQAVWTPFQTFPRVQGQGQN